MTKLPIVVALAVMLLAGCASPPKGWSSKEEIERTVSANIRVGDSKQKVQDFLTDRGIKWHELYSGPAARTTHAITAWVVVARRWPVVYEAGVSFSISKDETVDRITFLQEATGP